ncbi:MAG: DNA repair protein RadC [Acidobacteriota bacterium]|nr:DNA repair protein RadC [Acidobacteriota bacterium]MDH3785812.1 DNA repair protein RadC [Acidobacteriota bacterium]
MYGARRQDRTRQRRRPRHLCERLRGQGVEALTQDELLGLVLALEVQPVQRAQAVTRMIGEHGIEAIRGWPLDRLRAESGLPLEPAARLQATVELGRRLVGDQPEPRRPRIGGPSDAWGHLRELGRQTKEHLVGLYLDPQNGMIHRETISVGSLNITRAHPREILHPAIVHLAFGFLLAHNHPSGCRDPSPEDIEFTRSVASAAELLGIELFDHLVVTRDGYTSLRERGLL